ncbi:MAG: alpha/beta hydrolase [Clostridia bacterium]|nr:alpha/beta hydrolase [Clostridia bacterium]
MTKNEQKIAVLFPGIGYTCDRSLLYYTGKLLQKHGYELIRLAYGGFPANVKGDAAGIRQCVVIALDQTEEQLKDVDFGAYDDVVFVGKSIGTVVALRFAQSHGVDAQFVLLTPLERTFESVSSTKTVALQGNRAVAFHGTADPWARTDRIITACKSKSIPLYLTDDANHSLETGDVGKDIENLQRVLDQIWTFITD